MDRRNHDDETASVADPAFNLDPALMDLGDMLAQGQAEAASPFAP